MATGFDDAQRVAMAEPSWRDVDDARLCAPGPAHRARQHDRQQSPCLGARLRRGGPGEANARVAAAISTIRACAEVSLQGIDIPRTPCPGRLHDTTTDEVRIFDATSPSHAADLAALRRAPAKVRRWRAPNALGLGSTRPGTLIAVKARSRDWAQVRPEWGFRQRRLHRRAAVTDARSISAVAPSARL